MRATELFVEELARPEAAVRLDRACLLVAAHARPEADPEQLVAAGRHGLDQLAVGCPVGDLLALRSHLFDRLGFRGNRVAYDDPRNSLLDEVLARRTGIPITLSVVAMEVGRRAEVELVGVGLPGHFLLSAGRGRYLDAFDAGRLLDQDGARHRFAELAGWDAPWSEELLAPVGAYAIVARVLANLRRIYAERRDLRGVEWVLRLRRAVPGVPAGEAVALANVLEALGRYDEAARELERLAAAWADGGGHPSARPAPGEQTDGLRGRAAGLRARLN